MLYFISLTLIEQVLRSGVFILYLSLIVYKQSEINSSSRQL